MNFAIKKALLQTAICIHMLQKSSLKNLFALYGLNLKYRNTLLQSTYPLPYVLTPYV